MLNTANSERKNIGTIRQVVKWAAEDGWPISETCVRRLVREGSIRSFKSGTRNYIPYPSFCEFLGMVQRGA